MAINANKEIQRLRDAEDRVADKITTVAGNMKFVYLHTVWFALWILVNMGLLGTALVFDDFPFGLLTLIVSLEAIFLSTFVMISQNRQGEAAVLRSELDYQTDVKAELEIDIIMRTLERIAEKQGVQVDDLVAELEKARQQQPGLHTDN
jgi:uncharacterized membrane protein